MPRPLTDRQRSILDFISSSLRDKGVSPSYREIAAHFSITAGGLQKQIMALETKGVLRRATDRAARSLQVVGGQKIAGQVRLPILGQVWAGLPVEATENIEDHIVLDHTLARGAHFVLRVKGDSMEPDMRDGDLALVERVSHAVSGETVIAHVGDSEATMKLFRRQGRDIWLEARNVRYQPMRAPFKVIGRVVGFVRSYAN